MRRAVLVASLLLPGLAMAQAAPVPIDSVARGSQIRIWSRDPILKGWKLQYLGRTDTSLVVAERSGSARLEGFHNEIANSSIDRVEVSRGRRFDSGKFGRRMLKGAGIGLLAGAAFGALLGDADTSGEGLGAAGGAIFVGAAGSAIGMVVGGLSGMGGSSVWVQVRIP